MSTHSCSDYAIGCRFGRGGIDSGCAGGVLLTACVWLSACALSCAAAITALSPQRGGVALSARFLFVFGQGGMPGFTVCTCILAPAFGISRGGFGETH